MSQGRRSEEDAARVRVRGCHEELHQPPEVGRVGLVGSMDVVLNIIGITTIGVLVHN
jgi:hypothetical protein